MKRKKKAIAVSKENLKPERVQDGLTVRNAANPNSQTEKGDTTMSTNLNSNLNPSPDPTPQSKKKGKPSAFADILRDWESLLGAVEDQVAALASVGPRRAALADSLEKAKQAKVLQES